MSGEDSTRIGLAIESGNTDQLDRAVNEVLSAARRDHDGTEAIAGVAALMANRRFDAMLKLADGAARVSAPEQSWKLWPQAVQALIELGATNTAERLVKQLLQHDEPEAAPARGELSALLGRLTKTEYVSSGHDDDLVSAARAYVDAYHAGADPLWAGVNAIALRAAMARKGIADDIVDGPDVNQLLALAATAPVPRSAWAIATELELRLARGEKDAMTSLLTQLFDAHDASGFVFSSLARQLDEIWELDPTEPVMVMLGERTLASGRGEVVLPRDPNSYERMFGTEFPIPVEVYKEGLIRASSVGSLLLNGTFPAGTAFAMRGEDLHTSLAGRIVLVTNEHVVPDPSIKGSIHASELTANFSLVAGPDGAALSFGGLRTVFRSPRTELDVAVLVTDDPKVQQLTGLDVATTLPPVRDGAYVYVIGHPGGGGLQLSIRGNDLIDQDGVKLHYKAPTAKGSSGSPVFDLVWNLIGVHHMSSTDLKALNGERGTYPGNEGNSIAAVRAALAQYPGELPPLEQ